MSEIDRAIEELREQVADLRAEIERHEITIADRLGEIRGLERARELFEPPAKSGRVDVRRPVMALFGPGRGSWNEDGIVSEVDLPRLSVRKFLGRAVRDGKLVCKDGVYTMPRNRIAAE